MFALSGTVTLGEEPAEALRELGIDIRKTDEVISIKTELFAMNLDTTTNRFGYQGKRPVVLDGEVLTEVFTELKDARVFTELEIESLHIAEGLPFLLPRDGFEEYDTETDSLERYVKQSDESTTYRRDIGDFEFYAHSHEEVDGLHVHEIIHRNPGPNPRQSLEDLRDTTKGISIEGIDFAGHTGR